MTPTQAEAIAYGEREARRLKSVGLLTNVPLADLETALSVGYQSGLTKGRLETREVFADTVQTFNGEAA
jgi:hypothetical protein